MLTYQRDRTLGDCARGEIAQLGNVRALFARGDRDVLFLKNDGTVWRGIALFGAAWQARGLPAIEAVAISAAEVPILLAADGTVWTLDDADNGVPIAGIDDVVAIAVRRGDFISVQTQAFALRRDATVWWWRTDPDDSTAPQQIVFNGVDITSDSPAHVAKRGVIRSKAIGAVSHESRQHAATLHRHRRHHRVAAAEEGQPGGARHGGRADRIDPRGVRGGRVDRPPARAQRRRLADLVARTLRVRHGGHPPPLPWHDRPVLHRGPLGAPAASAGCTWR